MSYRAMSDAPQAYTYQCCLRNTLLIISAHTLSAIFSFLSSNVVGPLKKFEAIALDALSLHSWCPFVYELTLQ